MKGILKDLRLMALAVASASLVMAQVKVAAPSQQSASIRPGAVNYIEGQVALNGASLETNSLRSAVVQPGSDLSTGQGYAEVLLSPGAFLRLGNNSEIRLTSAGLVNTSFTLVHGSALVEAADVVKGSVLSVAVGNGTAQIDEKGLYSFAAPSADVKVLEGKLKINDSPAGDTTLRKGDEVILTSDRPLKKHNFSAKATQKDPLYVWSKVRSHDEAEASINVADEVASNGGWYGPGWYWDPAWSFYAFAPGWGYLGGPFGWNYYSPAFLYGGFWGGRYYGRGLYYGGHYAASTGGFHGGMAQAHAMGGMHAMGGGFHGGGGRR